MPVLQERCAKGGVVSKYLVRVVCKHAHLKARFYRPSRPDGCRSDLQCRMIHMYEVVSYLAKTLFKALVQIVIDTLARDKQVLCSCIRFGTRAKSTSRAVADAAGRCGLTSIGAAAPTSSS